MILRDQSWQTLKFGNKIDMKNFCTMNGVPIIVHERKQERIRKDNFIFVYLY